MKNKKENQYDSANKEKRKTTPEYSQHLTFNLNCVTELSVYKYQEIFAPTRAIAILMFVIEVHLRDQRVLIRDVDIINVMAKLGEEVDSATLKKRETSTIPFLMRETPLRYNDKKKFYFFAGKLEENLKDKCITEPHHKSMITKFKNPEEPIEHKLGELYQKLKNCCEKETIECGIALKFFSNKSKNQFFKATKSNNTSNNNNISEAFILEKTTHVTQAEKPSKEKPIITELEPIIGDEQASEWASSLFN